MFRKMDEEHWDRKEIYDLFRGYSYSMTMELDMTALRQYMRAAGKKFYPLICWLITKTVNADADFRMSVRNGEIGYFDRMNTSYTLLRKDTPHLFTHMVTEYTDDPDVYYERFCLDKQKAEAGNRLYYHGTALEDSVDISVTPNLSFQSISLSIPPDFYKGEFQNIKYSPFTIVGRFYERGGRVLLPVTVNFHHEVNDGYHAEKYFRLLQENLDGCFTV